MPYVIVMVHIISCLLTDRTTYIYLLWISFIIFMICSIHYGDCLTEYNLVSYINVVFEWQEGKLETIYDAFILSHFWFYNNYKYRVWFPLLYFLRKLKLIHSSLRPVYRLIETFSDQSRTAEKKQYDDVRLKFL